MHYLTNCFFVFFFCFRCYSQFETGSSSFEFSYVNDLFANTDRFYSQGILCKYTYVPSVSFSNEKHNRMLGYTFELLHDVYTPSTIKESILPLGDRPYAGVLEIRFCQEQALKRSKWNLLIGGSGGVVGPAAGGKQMQTSIHRLTNNFLPLGWNGQLPNGLILQTKGGLQRRFFYNKFCGFEGLSFAEIGTLRTNFNLVSAIKLGKLSGTNLIFMSWSSSIRLVGYDGTLQGAVFASRNGNEVAPFSIKRFVSEQHLELNYRLLSTYNTLRWECAAIFHFQSSLLEGAENHRWGGLKLKFGIGG